MKAGLLRHRVTFQRPDRERDSETGGYVTVWTTPWLDSETELVDVPAEVLTGPGREPIAAGATHAETDLRVNLRWFDGLQTTWRVLWEGAPYNIISAERDRTARREWRLRCTGGLSDGR